MSGIASLPSVYVGGNPSQPAVNAFVQGAHTTVYLYSTQSLPANTLTRVALNAVITDELNIWNPTTYQGTINKAGLYSVLFWALIANATSDTNYTVQLAVNSADSYICYGYLNTGTYLTASISVFYRLNSGDTFTFNGYCPSGLQVLQNNSYGIGTFFSMAWIGS
jgi:hypothetical protein